MPGTRVAIGWNGRDTDGALGLNCGIEMGGPPQSQINTMDLSRGRGNIGALRRNQSAMLRPEPC